MGQHFGHLSLDGEWEVARLAGAAYEAGDMVRVDVAECGIPGGTGIPWSIGDFASGMKVVDEACVDCRKQIGTLLEATAHKLAVRLADEALHFWMLGLIGSSFDENQAGLAESGGFVELQMRG